MYSKPDRGRDHRILRLVGQADHPLSTTQQHVAWQNAALRVECNQVRNSRTLEDSQAVRIVPIAERPYTAVVVPLAADGRLYLVGRYRYPIGRWSIEFPRFEFESGDAGWLDAAETDLLRIAGLKAARMSLLGAVEVDPALLATSAVTILAEGCSHRTTRGKTPVPSGNIREEADTLVAGCIAVQLTEMAELIQQGEITCGVTLAALSLYRARVR